MFGNDEGAARRLDQMHIVDRLKLQKSTTNQAKKKAEQRAREAD